MAATEAQQERRSDTVAIPRSTVKIVTWIASLAFVASATFVWNSGSAVHSLKTDLKVLGLRVESLERFGPVTGSRYTKDDAIRDQQTMVETHKEIKQDINYLREEMKEMRRNSQSHEERGGHSVMNSRMDKVESEVSDCCDRKWNGSLLLNE